ncbi:protein lin-31-like [Acanthaster planci]|uniref:Protein lin-31-like n=1 Tax=Acanthaster planci TaxID=133434 RepID=A0A8B7Y788_ACAPL|nr:protein lin-31-like [Acanthaster planci]XP_022088204.1 protein lin-31-like [Acanthaster planci]XP_022088205.1 protein lin-31-like [Acanthaster planci]
MTLFTIDKLTEKDAPRPAAYRVRRFQPYHPCPTVSDAAAAGYPGYLGVSTAPNPVPAADTGADHRRDECLNSTGGSPSISPGAFSAASSDAGLPEPDPAPCKVDQKDKQKSDEHQKPPHSYIALIAMAILASKEKRLLLCDIYQYIQEKFPYYRNNDRSWRNSIRHNLSLNECFIKYGRSGDGRGNFWAIHPANVEDFSRGDFHRRRARRRVRASEVMLHGYPMYHPYAASAAYPLPVATTPLGFVPMTVTTLPPYPHPVSPAVYPSISSPYPSTMSYPVPTLNPLPPLSTSIAPSTSPVSSHRDSPLEPTVTGTSSPDQVPPTCESISINVPSNSSAKLGYQGYPSTPNQTFFHYSSPVSRDSTRNRYPSTIMGLPQAPVYGYPSAPQAVITSSMGSYQTDSSMPRFLH